MPYFEGTVKLMGHFGVSVMQFPYAYLSQHNKIMAMYIQGHYERFMIVFNMQFLLPVIKCLMLNLTETLPFFSIQESFRQIVAEYLIDQELHTDLKLEKADVLQGAVLKIVDLPQPK